MDTSWWLGLAAVAALALVAALVEGSARPAPRRRPGGTAVRPDGGPVPPPGAAPAEGPRPGEIWQARVPWSDGPGPGADRPCLVLAVRAESVRVARITTRRRLGGGPGTQTLPLPPGAVGDGTDRAGRGRAGHGGPGRGRPGRVRTDALQDVPLRAFRHRVGQLDAAAWDRLRHLAD